MPKNNNLQTVSKQISTKSSHIVIGSSVAAGLTRYVTMLKVTQTQGATNGKGSRVIFCSTLLSGTASNPTAGSANGKIAVVIPSAVVSAIREQNDMLGYHRESAPNMEKEQQRKDILETELHELERLCRERTAELSSSDTRDNG